MKFRAIILSIFFLLPLVPAMAQDNDRDTFPISYSKPTVIFKLSEEDLAYRVLELCRYIPDHILKPEAKEAMTPEFFRALSEAFDAPLPIIWRLGTTSGSGIL